MSDDSDSLRKNSIDINDASSIPSPRSQTNLNINPSEFHLIPKEEVLSDIREKAINVSRKKTQQRWKRPCEKIALKGAVFGDLEIVDNKYIIFTPSSQERPDELPFRLGALKNSFLKNYKKRKQWNLTNISEIHARNYNLMPTAIELFVRSDGKTYFFNLYKDEFQRSFLKQIKEIKANIMIIQDRYNDFQK